MSKTKTLTVRLDEKTWGRLKRMQNKTPYTITLTSIVERGVFLAEQELDQYVPQPAQTSETGDATS